MKWNKALNGYYYAEPDKDTFYQIERSVFSNGRKDEFRARLYLKEHDDFQGLHSFGTCSLSYAKRIANNHYKEKLKGR